MTVSDLIAELQQMPPQLPVRVLLAEVTGFHPALGPFPQTLGEEDAEPADEVRQMGGYVLIRSK